MKKRHLNFMRRVGLTTAVGTAVGLALTSNGFAGGTTIPNPVIYVEQIPVTKTTNSVVAIGGSHLADTNAAPRGGSLKIVYSDGFVKNLTHEAGYGLQGDQNANPSKSIAVRDPEVHWDGERVLVSMVVGAPTSANDQTEFFWQIYEVTGLERNDMPVFTKLANQPEDFNNIQPTYGSDDKVFFISDRTLDGSRTLYPAIDETGTGRAVTGLWSLDPADGGLVLVDHSPSGSFNPFVDSYGRVVFSRWDHLQRDEKASTQGGFDYESEEEGAGTVPWLDVYPETILASGDETGHKFDLFLPWTVNQDGTGLLTMNHLGRHELGTNAMRSRTDRNLVDIEPNLGRGTVGSPTRAGSYLQMDEDAQNQGVYIATDAISTATSAGRLVTFSAPLGANPDGAVVTVANSRNLVRDPAYLDDGRIIGTATSGPVITGSYGSTRPAEVTPTFIPTTSNPFTLRVTAPGSGTDISTGLVFVPPTSTSVSFFVPGSNTKRTFNGRPWQLQPKEVIARTAPNASIEETLPAPETSMFESAGVEVEALKTWLRDNEKALLVARNVTSRDANDQQQPFSLYVPGGTGSLFGSPTYAVSSVQFFQGDYVRGYTNTSDPYLANGRRIVSRPMHDAASETPPDMPTGSTPIAPDGSMAVIVPAGRALTWQLADPDGNSVVRERYWLNFRAGEIRTCTNCHGSNTEDQIGRYAADIDNPPAALKTLLTQWAERYPAAASGLSPYDYWAQNHLAEQTAPNEDPDTDGMSNLAEFVYGTNPSVAEPAGSVTTGLQSALVDDGGGASVVLSFTRSDAAASVRVAIEASEDLKTWTEAAVLSASDVETDGSVLVSTTATPEQVTAKVQQVSVRKLVPAEFAPNTYYRLKFGE